MRKQVNQARSLGQLLRGVQSRTLYTLHGKVFEEGPSGIGSPTILWYERRDVAIV